jgi:hypothetical protein
VKIYMEGGWSIGAKYVLGGIIAPDITVLLKVNWLFYVELLTV